jgi:hypothetical protein
MRHALVGEVVPSPYDCRSSLRELPLRLSGRHSLERNICALRTFLPAGMDTLSRRDDPVNRLDLSVLAAWYVSLSRLTRLPASNTQGFNMSAWKG